MLLTNKEMLQSVEPLQSIFGQKMPAKTAFRVAAVIRTINCALETYQTVLDKVLSDFSERDAAGNIVRVNGVPQISDQLSFSDRVEALLEQTIHIPGEKISVDDLGTNVIVEPSSVALLGWLLLE